MKKTIIISIALLTTLCATATDRFYILDFTINPGETKQVSIMLKNDVEYTAFQADLFLPEGLTVEQEDDEYIFDLTSRKANDHTITSLLHSDGSIRIISYSMNVRAFKGNSGPLVTFNVTASEEFEGPVDIYLRNIRFTTPLGEEILFANEYCYVTTSKDAFLQGDVNGDGSVTIGDVTAIIDYLLSADATSINLQSADVNFSGSITIGDVTALIDYLLSRAWPKETLTVRGIKFKMVTVDAGSFMMGATEEQGSDAYEWESPVHQVTLTSYMIGETEVTQELWLAVMGTNPSKHTGDLQKPVDNVNWNDCQEFIGRLNELTGKSFRLPTEAEWEYAARGGDKGHGYKYAGSDNIDDVGWISSNAESTTHPVACLQPNELSLYDMTGNVDEWVADYWGDYTSASQTNPTGPENGTDRVYRGGSWYGSARASRVSYRYHRSPTYLRGTMGLRLAL